MPDVQGQPTSSRTQHPCFPNSSNPTSFGSQTFAPEASSCISGGDSAHSINLDLSKFNGSAGTVSTRLLRTHAVTDAADDRLTIAFNLAHAEKAIGRISCRPARDGHRPRQMDGRHRAPWASSRTVAGLLFLLHVHIPPDPTSLVWERSLWRLYRSQLRFDPFIRRIKCTAHT